MATTKQEAIEYAKKVYQENNGESIPSMTDAEYLFVLKMRRGAIQKQIDLYESDRQFQKDKKKYVNDCIDVIQGG